MSAEQYRRSKSVLVVVYTDSADVLLLKRSRPFTFWQSITGSLHSGEEPAEAARRELREETGLTDEGCLTDGHRSRHFEIDPRWRNRYQPGVTRNKEFEWRYRLTARTNVQINEAEHSAYRWYPIDEAIEQVWSWTNKEALMRLRVAL